ncbi:hypothetical protein D3C76_1371090 [compost metagenome]
MNTVTELTYRADLIVTGSFTGNRTPKFYTDDNNEIIVKASISEFEVGSLYKGNIDDRIISVVEPGYEDDSSIYTIEGYKLMNDTDEYVLFLNDTYDGSYRIVGMYQGQYKLENALGRNALNYFDEETEYFESEDQIEHFTRLKEQVVEKIALFEKEE